MGGGRRSTTTCSMVCTNSRVTRAPQSSTAGCAPRAWRKCHHCHHFLRVRSLEGPTRPEERVGSAALRPRRHVTEGDNPDPAPWMLGLSLHLFSCRFDEKGP